jgi:outer membrane biosynthesis protein TonB
MKHFKKYSIFVLLILIIIANLFFVNREGYTLQQPMYQSTPPPQPTRPPQSTPPTQPPQPTPPPQPTRPPQSTPPTQPPQPTPPTEPQSTPPTQPTLPPQPSSQPTPPPQTPQPMPSSSSVGSYAMVCSNDTDCDRYNMGQYNFKGSIDQNGITINREKTYSCQNGVCTKK